MRTYKDWLDRIENNLILMKDLPHWDTVTMILTRRDLIELKLIIETLMILIEEKEKR